MIILAPLAAAVLFTLYWLLTAGGTPADFFTNSAYFEDYASVEDILVSLFNLSPIFFFIIYIASMGRVVTASAFSNCDIQMLHYPYYRIGKTILASFRSRFSVILRYNFIVSSVISFSVLATVTIIFGEMDLMRAGVFFVLLTFIGVFFAFNDLFLYYVIQPYDSAGKSKSIIYSIINFVIYFIAYMNLQMRFELITYSIIIIAATFLYLGIGTALLLSLAPKKFKLR
jgi:hypothetical protein